MLEDMVTWFKLMMPFVSELTVLRNHCQGGSGVGLGWKKTQKDCYLKARKIDKE